MKYKGVVIGSILVLALLVSALIVTGGTDVGAIQTMKCEDPLINNKFLEEPVLKAEYKQNEPVYFPFVFRNIYGTDYDFDFVVSVRKADGSNEDVGSYSQSYFISSHANQTGVVKFPAHNESGKYFVSISAWTNRADGTRVNDQIMHRSIQVSDEKYNPGLKEWFM
jgi:hypothetical protein